MTELGLRFGLQFGLKFGLNFGPNATSGLAENSGAKPI